MARPLAFWTLLLLPLFAFGGCAQAERIVNENTYDSGSVRAANWELDALGLEEETGPLAFDCPPNPSREGSPLWGSNPYTHDSSICKAGVHAGVITFERGGRVTIEMRPGQSSYPGSTRHGVQSDDYGQWYQSYAVVNGR